MDNAPIHRSEELKEMCDDYGVRLEFLPPYSPDYNPIEESFAELKKWMKRTQSLVPLYIDNFGGYIELGIRQMADRAGNHFRSAHIVNN